MNAMNDAQAVEVTASRATHAGRYAEDIRERYGVQMETLARGHKQEVASSANRVTSGVESRQAKLRPAEGQQEAREERRAIAEQDLARAQRELERANRSMAGAKAQVVRERALALDNARAAVAKATAGAQPARLAARREALVALKMEHEQQAVAPPRGKNIWKRQTGYAKNSTVR